MRQISHPDRWQVPAVPQAYRPKPFRHPRPNGPLEPAKPRWNRSAWPWLPVLVVLLGIGKAPLAHAQAPGAEPVSSGSLLLSTENGARPAPRQNTSIRAVITGPTARVVMTQRFTNDSNEWVEAVYVFPLPDDAAVDHLRLQVGERLIEGEIQRRAEARRNYEAALSEGRRAGLVEQERANLFTTRLANIGPGEKIDVTIQYQQSARFDGGEYSLRIPLTLTPRYTPGAASSDRRGNGWSAPLATVAGAEGVTPPMVAASSSQRLQFEALIDAGVPLARIESRYHEIAVRPGGQRYELSLTDTDVSLDHDIELVWAAADLAMTHTGVLGSTRDDEHFALLLLYPPALRPDGERPAREMIFVIDTSGSMHGNSIVQAKAALALAIERLRTVDRFNVIEFNSRTRRLFSQPMAADENNRRTARDWVARLQANNGTEMEPALRAALQGQPPAGMLRQVVFVTDGSVSNEAQLFELIRGELHGARLFTVGIGSAPNAWFMRKAAEAGRGTFAHIGAVADVQRTMSALFEKLEQPVLTDIGVTWPSGIVAEGYPAIVPDLYAGEPIVVTSRLSRPLPPGSVIEVRGRLGSRDWRQQISTHGAQAYDGIAVLWARARIESLGDRLRAGGNRVALVDEMTATALRHHLVSEYTSLIAVDRTPVRPATSSVESRQVPNLVAHGQSLNRVAGFPATATPAPLQRLFGLLALLAGLGALTVSHVTGLRDNAYAR